MLNVKRNIRKTFVEIIGKWIDLTAQCRQLGTNLTKKGFH